MRTKRRKILSALLFSFLLTGFGLAQAQTIRVITKHGKPVARLTPFSADSASLIGALAGKVRITGDILSTGAVWNAES